MTFAQMTPWQLLLWIVALEMASAPLIIFLFTSINNARYRARENHIVRITAAFGKALEKTINEVTSKMEATNRLMKFASKFDKKPENTSETEKKQKEA